MGRERSCRSAWISRVRLAPRPLGGARAPLGRGAQQPDATAGLWSELHGGAMRPGALHRREGPAYALEKPGAEPLQDGEFRSECSRTACMTDLWSRRSEVPPHSFRTGQRRRRGAAEGGAVGLTGGRSSAEDPEPSPSSGLLFVLSMYPVLRCLEGAMPDDRNGPNIVGRCGGGVRQRRARSCGPGLRGSRDGSRPQASLGQACRGCAPRGCGGRLPSAGLGGTSAWNWAQRGGPPCGRGPSRLGSRALGCFLPEGCRAESPRSCAARRPILFCREFRSWCRRHRNMRRLGGGKPGGCGTCLGTSSRSKQHAHIQGETVRRSAPTVRRCMLSGSGEESGIVHDPAVASARCGARSIDARTRVAH